MYSPLNEQLMFQEMRDRTERLRATHDHAHHDAVGPHGDRRWWRRRLQRAARRAR